MKHKIFTSVLIVCALIGVIYFSNSKMVVLFFSVWVWSVITFLGVYFIRLNWFVESVNNVSEGEVALTFDDGPDPILTPQILAILRKRYVKATFFLIGKKAEEHPDLVRQILNEGHQIGNHSYSHSNQLGIFSAQKLTDDIARCTEVLEAISLVPITTFRPPFGVTNPRYTVALNKLGLKSVGWSLRSYDTVLKEKATLEKRLVKKLNSGNIVLLHDTQLVTCEVLEELIDHCEKMNLKFVVVK